MDHMGRWEDYTYSDPAGIYRTFSYLDSRHVLGEALVLLANLERQLSGVAHHQHWYLRMTNCWFTFIITTNMWRLFLAPGSCLIAATLNSPPYVRASGRITCPVTGSSCWSVANTNTAVFPMPDLAWHNTSMPRMAWGMHSCWTVRAKRDKTLHANQQITLNPK